MSEETPATNPLASALRAARAGRDLTQGQLAAVLGVSQSTISFWERGVAEPSAEHIIAMAVEFPEIVDYLPARERELLRRLLQIERRLFDGRCACPDCRCTR